MDIQGLRKYVLALPSKLQDESGNWKVKGFIDIERSIYTLNTDTKVISKALELVITPYLTKYFREKGVTYNFVEHQNHYPDIDLSDGSGKIALDLKSTYFTDDERTKCRGLTLGAYLGYFRNRNSKKNIYRRYSEYRRHLVLGLIYERNEDIGLPEIRIVTELNDIISVISNIQVFLQDKWKIAGDKPGSGNMTNIGSSDKVDDLVNGKAIFTKLGNEGKKIFNDYWVLYETKSMARAADRPEPMFKDLRGYLEYKNLSGLIDRLEGNE